MQSALREREKFLADLQESSSISTVHIGFDNDTRNTVQTIEWKVLKKPYDIRGLILLEVVSVQ
jgi:hypothetical protein